MTDSDLVNIEMIQAHLQESINRLLKMRAEIDELIRLNEIAVEALSTTEAKEKEIQNLKNTVIVEENAPTTIRELWDKRTRSVLLVVQKPKWTNDFCFVVHSIEDSLARGTTYHRNENGEISVHTPRKSYPCDQSSFMLFPQERREILREICNLE